MDSSGSKTERLIEAFLDPEYRFLFLEPVLFWGILAGWNVFVAGFVRKHPGLQTTGLLLIALSALCFVPYLSARNASQPRIEQIYRFTQTTRGTLFAENTAAWESSRWVYLTLALLAAATVIIGARRNQLGYVLSAAVILTGLGAAHHSLWRHYRDAVAAHPNLRTHQAPVEVTVSPDPVEPAEEEGDFPGRTESAVSTEKDVPQAPRRFRQVEPIDSADAPTQKANE